MTENEKLPQARMFLRSARWGFDYMMANRLEGYAFRFHIIGVLAALRAVQHSLYEHDRDLSPDHKKVISEWWAATKNDRNADLEFIRNSRNAILKRGDFVSDATYSESATGEGKNRTVTRTDYEVAHYAEGQRRDLAADLQSALDWCERELETMEAKLPVPR